MSKWNKSSEPLSAQFLENEERRKQMIIEAAKRRKEKEKKQQEQQQNRIKTQKQALVKHKQEKKDAYIKYLRSNMHDKYEEIKIKKKEQDPEIKPMSKWKKKSADKNQNAEEDQQLEALDLDVKVKKTVVSQFNSSDAKEKNSEKGKVQSQKRKTIAEQFEREWQMQIDTKQQLLSSKLLDSLDLDIGTIRRQCQINNIIKQKTKDQELNMLKNLIGYESVVVTQKPNSQQLQKQKVAASKPVNKQTPKIKEVNEVEMFNELKNKKEAKIFHWAIEEDKQAEDLFSNCSSKKKSTKALQQLNQQMKNAKKTNPTGFKKKTDLHTIKEVQKQKNSSKQRKPNSKQIPKDAASNPNVNKTQPRQSSKQKSSQINGVNKIVERKTSGSFQNFKKQNSAIPQQEGPKTTTGFNSQKNITRIRTTSRQKSIQKKQQPLMKQLPRPQGVKKVFGNLPPLPVAKENNNSIATHDMQFDIESFIKQDLMNLNQQEYKIQSQLRQIHKNHKDTIKQVYGKFQIKTDYKRSSQITGEQSNKQYKYVQNQDDLQDSIQNLDNILLRKQINNRDNTIRQETEESQSFINPFSNSDDLCNQVLRLAQNVSRFQKKPTGQQKNGYGYMNKVKRDNSANKNQDYSKVSKVKVDQEQLSQSKQVSQIQQMPLSRPPFIFDASEISSKYNNDGEQKKQKIHVNAKLLKGLLLDD